MYKVFKIGKSRKLDFFFQKKKQYRKFKWRALSQILTNRAKIWDLSSVRQEDYALKCRKKRSILNHFNIYFLEKSSKS